MYPLLVILNCYVGMWKGMYYLVFGWWVILEVRYRVFFFFFFFQAPSFTFQLQILLFYFIMLRLFFVLISDQFFHVWSGVDLSTNLGIGT